MPTTHVISRRSVVALAASAAAAMLVTFGAFTPAHAQPSQGPLKIGIIGTGKIGGALARHWVKAGHEQPQHRARRRRGRGVAEEGRGGFHGRAAAQQSRGAGVQLHSR
ncbi:MAG TPA: NAD(P)-binding domain-containing protein, partial [Gammaproteobacteria bacterium]|nr:NAD(P)-binding domain-containing protein [Gammaproteobacteria bacterium]